MKSAPAIAFDCRPSRWLLGALASVSLLALIALAAAGLALWLKLVAAAALCAYAGRALTGLIRHPVRRCAWHDSGHWRVRDAAGEEHAAILLHATIRGPLIALVLLAGPLRKTALILLPDNCDAETRRRLRVRLARASVEASSQI